MDFVNTTQFGAGSLCTSIDRDRMLSAVIARPCFRIEGDELVETPGDWWPVGASPVETSHGELPGDLPFLNGGVDVMVLGSAHAPDGAPTRRLRQRLRIGKHFERATEVIGDRHWVRLGDGLIATEPEPFTSMPLGYAQAYGGTLKLEEGKLGFPANPSGKGFYLTREQAEGQPLPNLEDPDALIECFDDQPEPVGSAPYPKEGSLRQSSALELDLGTNEDDPRIQAVRPLLFNAAHPRMVIAPAESPEPGDRIELTHARPEGALSFALPALSLHLHVQLEERSSLFPLHLDQIAIFSDEERVVLSYRVAFRYHVIPLERRCAMLHRGPLPERVPADYVQRWAD